MSNIDKYGFCPVTEPIKRKEHLKLLSKKISLLSQLKDELSANELQDYKEALEQFDQLTRIDRAENDVLYFAYEYFGDEKNPDNDDNLIPQGVHFESAPDFHIELCNMLNVVSNEEITKRIAWASPRGSAKSAYLSNIFPLHQTVFQKRKYILIISETDSISKKFMEYISNQLKHNKKLREDFGELLSPHKQRNELDNLEMFLTTTRTLVESASIGKQLRGKRNGAARPDLIICDDLESSKNTNTPELREKNLHWFNSVVIPIGDPKRTAFVYMGTAVHQNGLLFEVMNRADFQSKLFSAILQGPDREDLWEKFEEILRDSSNENRMSDANQFYENNREEMDRGVQVLWEQRWSYKDLMVEKTNMTSRSFASEFLNNPVDIESQVFNPNSFQYFDSKEHAEVEPFLEYFGAWDMAFGRSNRSDYNAIIIVGRDRRTGLLYVVHSWAKKVAAHIALEEVVKVIREYQPKVFAVETVQAQIDLYRQLQQRLMKENLYFTKLKPITTNRSHGKKEDRIEQMEPLFENGAVRFRRTQRLLLEQLEMFPYGDHDDLPDALQMTLELCSLNGRRRSWTKKPRGL
ncbi:phage terminase large subunit [Bacillus sp. FSL M7-0417]|uniref:phage terminase large subunit n=1 Tax=Bacillus sp. FSL M7-0417 TaxID=2921532 RepID=UPI002E1B8BF6|nr:phage terminase large subunit [Bacillus subtilis]